MYLRYSAAALDQQQHSLRRLFESGVRVPPTTQIQC